MLKKTITYTDYDGNERTEDFYFGLNKAELLELEMSVSGGYQALLQKIISEKDMPRLISIFKELVLKSYGAKSLDGKRFIKNEELTNEFIQTEAYSDLFMSLAADANAAAEFCNGIMPASIVKAANEQINAGNLTDTPAKAAITKNLMGSANA